MLVPYMALTRDQGLTAQGDHSNVNQICYTKKTHDGVSASVAV